MNALASTPALPAIFTFHRAYDVRVLVDEQGNPLFHANDLCAVLQYVNPRAAIKQHVEQGDVVKRDTPTPGGIQANNYVAEAGMWALVMGSSTARSKQVKRWVTAEVLPALRRTGVYVMARHVHPGAEALSANDMANLRRMVWRASVGQLRETNWIRTCWQCLRRSVGIGTGDRFLVEHLPVLARELERLCAISDAMTESIKQTNDRVLIAIATGATLQDMTAIPELRNFPQKPDPLKLGKWTRRDFDRLIRREPAMMDHHEVAES